jgi:tetratricopeptide (TPR) repeat protein
MQEPQKLVQNLTPKNVRLIMIGAAAVCVVLGGIAWGLHRREETQQRAREAYFNATRLLESERLAMEPPGKKDLKPALPSLPKKLDVKKSYPQATEALEKVATQYSKTRSGYEARITLGNLFFDHGQPGEAAKQYEQASEAAPTEIERNLALNTQGTALENNGQCTDAIRVWEKALRTADKELPRGDIYLGIARCQETLKDTQGARSTYERIITELPGTYHAQTAQVFRDKLN